MFGRHNSSVPLQPPHPSSGSLWPGLTVEQVRTSLRQTARLVHAVIHRADDPVLWHGNIEESEQAFAVAAFLSGVGPWLGRIQEQGELFLPDRFAQTLADQLAAGRVRFRRLQLGAIDVLDEFLRLDLDTVLLKGIHTANLCFVEPAVRPMSDIDLLVHPRDFERAGRALRRQGFEVVHTTVGRSTTYRKRDSATEVACLSSEHPDNPWTIDLHQAMDCQVHRGLHTRFGGLPFETRQTATILGRDVFVLEPSLLLLHLAVHASYHVPSIRLMRIVELVLCIEHFRHAGQLDWDRLRNLADRTDCVRLAYPAFELAERLKPGSVDPGFRDALFEPSTTGIRQVVDQIESEGFSGWGMAAGRIDHRFVWNHGVRDWLFSLWDVMWPGSVRPRDLWAVQVRRIGLAARWWRQRKAA